MKGASKGGGRNNEGSGSATQGDGKIKSPISTRSGRRLSSTGSAGPSPAMKTPTKQSPTPRTPGSQGPHASQRLTPSSGSKVVTGSVSKVTPGRKVTPTRATRSNPAIGSRGSVLDKLRANREKQERLKEEQKTQAKLDSSVLSSPEPMMSTTDSEMTETSSELMDNMNEVTGEDEKEESKLAESGEDESDEAAKITSVDNNGMEVACGTDSVDLQVSGEVKDPEAGGDVLEAEDVDSDDLKTTGEKCDEDETVDKVKKKGNTLDQQQDMQKTVFKSIEMEAVDVKVKTNTEIVKSASKSLEKEVLVSGLNAGVSAESVVTVKTRNVSAKMEPKSSRSSVSNQSDGVTSIKSVTSVKSEPNSLDSATPKIPGIRTRLKTGSIHMNGTTTISVSKEKAEQENIMKQIAAK
ncbi:hypothetical protein DPMN_069801, partial [Dreissena polymorpha]